jgi:hypothetical protein
MAVSAAGIKPLSPRLDYRHPLSMATDAVYRWAGKSWEKFHCQSVNVGRGLAVEAERRGILRGRFRISFRDMKSWEYQSSDLPGMVGQFMDDCERAGCIVDRDALTVESPI